MNEDQPLVSPPEHEVYLLRVWYEFDGSNPVWRSSVLVPYTPQRRYFATPEALLQFLGEQVMVRHAAGVDLRTEAAAPPANHD